MTHPRLIAALLAFLFSLTLPISAKFQAVALEDCPAWNDLRHSRNQGDLHLKQGESYRIVREHKGEYLVRLPGPPASQRWVDPKCLRPLSKRHETKGNATEVPEENSALESLLVLTWHNAFCETHPNRKECRPLSNHSANRLVLHGLWPQPPSRIYCKVSEPLVEADRKGLWRSLPEPRLPEKLRRALLRYMPGSLSALHRHEWIKHGSCYDPDPVRYFRDALSLTEEVDRSLLGEYLRANVGGKVQLAQLRKIFERSFGKGTGNRLVMECRRGLISELRISLRGKGDRLSPLLPKAKPLRGGCREGIVDGPGAYRKR